MIIQYESAEDQLAAELIQKKIGGNLHFGSVDPNSLNEDIVIVGGWPDHSYGYPGANQTYRDFAALGIIPYLFVGDPGYVYVGTHLGYNVYAAAGWGRSGTIAAAEYIYLNSLPEIDTLAGDLGELHIVSIPINPKVLGTVSSALSQIETQVIDAVSGFYTVREITLADNNLEILLRSDVALGLFDWRILLGWIAGAVMIALGIFAGPAIIITLVVAGGLTIAATVIYSFVTGITQQAVESLQEVIDYKTSKGFTLEDAKEEANAFRLPSTKDIIKYAILLGGLGVGGYFIMQGIIQKRGG